MSAAPRLAIVLPGDAEALAPAHGAIGMGQGGFASVEIARDGGAANLGPFQALHRACDLAVNAGCDWVLKLAPGETLLPNALDIVAPALVPYDAIFGAVSITGSGQAVWRPSRLSFDAPERLPHALLVWWIGRSPLLRVAAAREALGTPAEGGASSGEADLDLLFALWSRLRCIKLAQPLLEVAAEPAPLGLEARAHVLARLAAEPVFLPVDYGGRTYRLPYTGVNAGIEREQSRGLFFEAEELHALRDRVGPNRRIVDIGANTGNHTVYFAGPMQAETVIPIEPLPDVSAILARTVEVNGLANVDVSALGLGVSDRAGRARVVRSSRGGLGASRLESDDHGDIVVSRLDDILTVAPDFLKIDVESMEMAVLAGAERTIATARPLIFIEIANDNTAAFAEWLARSRYRIERIFSDKGHSNYLIAPDGA